MFRVSTTPIIRSTQNCNYSLRYCSYFLCSYLPPTWPSLITLEGGSCTVPETVVTVFCTPDDGCGWRPKHVHWTCRIINRLLCVTSRWTIINIRMCCFIIMGINLLEQSSHWSQEKDVSNVSAKFTAVIRCTRLYTFSVNVRIPIATIGYLVN